MRGKETFRGPELKLHRAETHIIDLHGLLKRFMEAQTYKIIADFEREPGYICFVGQGEEVFPHDEFAPIIGDVIHNLRDALDLAVSVIMRNAGRSDRGVMFLTGRDANAFKRAIKQRSEKVKWPQDFLQVLETRIQPYEGGNGYLLRVLHELSITDKHRLLVPTVFGTSSVTVNTEGIRFPIYTGVYPVAIKDGGVYFRCLTSDFPDIKVGQKANVTLSIAFDGIGRPLDAIPVDDALRRLLQKTKEAIDALRSCL